MASSDDDLPGIRPAQREEPCGSGPDERAARGRIAADHTACRDRAGFDSQLERMIREARSRGSPLSLVLFDIDRFGAVNARHGHETGNRILGQLSRLIQGMLPDGHVLHRPYRAVFAVVAPDTDARAAIRLAERIRARVSDRAFGPLDRLCLSCGVAQLAADDDGAALLQRARSATGAARRAGGNQACASQ